MLVSDPVLLENKESCVGGHRKNWANNSFNKRWFSNEGGRAFASEFALIVSGKYVELVSNTDQSVFWVSITEYVAPSSKLKNCSWANELACCELFVECLAAWNTREHLWEALDNLGSIKQWKSAVVKFFLHTVTTQNSVNGQPAHWLFTENTRSSATKRWRFKK